MKEKGVEFVQTYHRDENECSSRDFNSSYIPTYRHYNFTDVTFLKAFVKPAQDNIANAVYLLYQLTYSDHGTQYTYVTVRFDGILNTLEGVDIGLIHPHSLGGLDYLLPNPDTHCAMIGMEEADLPSAFETFGIQYE